MWLKTNSYQQKENKKLVPTLLKTVRKNLMGFFLNKCPNKAIVIASLHSFKRNLTLFSLNTEASRRVCGPFEESLSKSLYISDQLIIFPSNYQNIIKIRKRHLCRWSIEEYPWLSRYDTKFSGVANKEKLRLSWENLILGLDMVEIKGWKKQRTKNLLSLFILAEQSN